MIGRLDLEKVMLASGSPRRREIMTAVGWPFEVRTPDVDESVRPGEDPVDYVQRLAQEKALAVTEQIETGLVLAADTTVVIEREILGKPEDDEDAKRMLRLLSGKWHEVLTGVSLVRVNGPTVTSFERTRVRFAAMTEEEIDWYVSLGEPLGKAGAYGIQGPAALFIEEIEGDYLNIVGLPVRLVYELWQKLSE
ncbi:MAG TPA: Maf family protein [Pyrinomonadaceae bacterium]|nr:Maf family protein [Pyrinomonadaceae bacterium]